MNSLLNWLTITTTLLTVLGAGFSLIQLISPREISRIITSLASYIKNRWPALSLRIIMIVTFILVCITLIISIGTLVNFTFSGTNSSNLKPPVSQYSYTSNTDVHNFTTKLTWDASAMVQHSMSIDLDVQPNSSASDIAKLSQKFGPGYTFYIVAQLDADGTTFTAAPKDQIQQPIDQGNFSFHWIATPLHPGDQAVDVVIKGIWIPQNNSGKQMEYYLGSHTWHISVADNTQVFVFGQFNLAQILGYVFSVIVSVAFIQFVTTFIQSRKQVTTQATQPSATQSPPTQPPATQPAPAQSPAIQPSSNQSPAVQSPTANNQQNTQQPVP